MSKLSVSLRITNPTLLALIVASAASASIGCSKEEEAPKRAWACESREVPMGESIRCTSAALTADGPVVSGSTTDGTGSVGSSGGTSGTTDGVTTTGGAGGSATTSSSGGTTTDGTTTSGGTTGTGGTGTGGSSGTVGSPDGTMTGGTAGTTGGTGAGGGSSSGGTSDGTVVFRCPLGNDNPECPDDSHGNGKGNNGRGLGNGGANGSWTGGSANGSGAGGGSNTGGTSDGTTGTTSSSGSTSSGGAGSGTGTGTGTGSGSNTGGTSDGTTGSTSSSGNGNGNGGGGGGKSPSECSYVPDLPYCGGGGSSSGGSSSGGTTSSGGTGSTDGARSNGKGNGGGSSSGGSSSGGTGTTDGTGGASNGGSNSSSGGHSYVCKKDKKGNIDCETETPVCVPGSHPSACGACIEDGSTDDCVPPVEGGCWVTGGGFIIGPTIAPTAAPADGHDNFGGNAKPMKKGGVSGHWNHVDHGTGNHSKGRPEYIMCRTVAGEPGPSQPGGKKGLTANQVYFGGHAQWRVAADGTWADGYWFDVVVEDHGEPGSQGPAAKKGQMPDYYHFTIRKMDDPTAKVSGAIAYETKENLMGGNIQIHPSNNGHPGVNYPLPPWVALEN